MPISSTGYHYSYICDYYASYDACYETIKVQIHVNSISDWSLHLYYDMVEF